MTDTERNAQAWREYHARLAHARELARLRDVTRNTGDADRAILPGGCHR